jgi:hypothetical protein
MTRLDSVGDREVLLDRLDGSGSDAEWAAVLALRELDNLPQLLLAKYSSSRRWSQRASCVYHAARYARENRSAFDLGIAALRDRSEAVRYRATMLLAYAQNAEALAPLKQLAKSGASVEDAMAAIDAIESRNHHFFVDRTHSGMMVLNLEDAR